MWKYTILLIVLGSLLAAPTAFAQLDDDGSMDIDPDEAESGEAEAPPAEEPPSDEGAMTAAAEIDMLGDEPQDEEPEGGEKKVEGAVAVKVGGTFHTIFNELKPFVILELEGGIMLLERHLEIDLTVGWARPPVTYSSDDPRLTGADFSWEIKQDFLTFGLMARGRIFKKESRFNLYGALGPRLFLMRSVTTGKSDGEPFGENKQFETRFGGAGAIGGEFNIGPGAILVEALMCFGNLEGFITGDHNSAALDLYAGYRFMF